MNVELTAREPFEYNHASLKAGEDFKATELHAKILVNSGRATYKTRQMEAERGAGSHDGEAGKGGAIPPSAEDEPKQRGRRYRRRDMQADDET